MAVTRIQRIGRRDSAAPISLGGDEQPTDAAARSGMRRQNRPRILRSHGCFVAGRLGCGTYLCGTGIAQCRSGGPHDESGSSPRVHDARLRLRHRPLPGSRDQPRDYLRRGEGHDLRAARASPQSHARARARSACTRSPQKRHSCPIRYALAANRWARHTDARCRRAEATRFRNRTPFSRVARTLRFYLGDCVDVLAALPPPARSPRSSPRRRTTSASTTAATTTRCRASDYLDWTGAWIAAAARVLAPDGSLFLNVGAKPTDPWTAMDVAQAARQHLQLQNTIHWIKSIAIDREAAGAGAALDRDLAVGHYKPINSPRFVNDCHEFIFHFTPGGRTPLDRRADRRARTRTPSNIAPLADRRQQPPLPRQHLVHSLRDDQEPRQGPPAPGRPFRRGYPSTASSCTA